MNYELAIGTKNWSSWSLRAWLALKVPGIPFIETVISLRQSDSSQRIKALSPSARVPVLIVEEQGTETAVFDSLAICETIAERHPEAGLWPDDPMVRAVARSYAAEMHSSFLTLREALSMDFARTLDTPELSDTLRNEIERIQSAWQSALSKYGADGGFLFGRFSIADCMYAPVVSRFLTYGISMPAELEQYAERVMALPAMQEWMVDAKQEIVDGLPDQWKVDMVRNAR